MATDLYEVLGVPGDATQDEIRRAYAQLVRQYPPAQHPEEFQQIRRAYEVLSDPDRRAEYDSSVKYGAEVKRKLDEATRLAEAQNWLAAIPLLREVVAFVPELDEARHFLALCYRNAGDLEAAIDTFRELIARSSHPDYWVELGQVYLRMAARDQDAGLLWEARNAFENAIGLDSEHWEAHYALGIIHRRFGENEEALRWAGKSFDLARAPEAQLDSFLLVADIYCTTGRRYRISELAHKISASWKDEPTVLSALADGIASAAVSMSEEGRVDCANALMDAAAIIDAKYESSASQAAAAASRSGGGHRARPGPSTTQTGASTSSPSQTTSSTTSWAPSSTTARSEASQDADGAGCGVALVFAVIGFAIFNVPGAIIGFIIGMSVGSKD